MLQTKVLTLSLREREEHSKIRFAQWLCGKPRAQIFSKPECESPSPLGRGPGWGAGQDMGNTLGQDMGYTFILLTLLRRSALRAVERSGECDSTHREAEPPAGRGATSAHGGEFCVRFVFY